MRAASSHACSRSPELGYSVQLHAERPYEESTGTEHSLQLTRGTMAKGSKKRKAASLTTAPEEAAAAGEPAATTAAAAAKAPAAPRPALRPAHDHTAVAPTGLGKKLAAAPGRLALG